MNKRHQLMLPVIIGLLLTLGITASAQQKPAQKPAPSKPSAPPQSKAKPATQTPAKSTTKAASTAAASPPATPPKPTLDELISSGVDLLRQNKPDDAAKQFRQAISLYPNDVRAYGSLAAVDIQTKHYDEAVQMARIATLLVENGPTNQLVAAYNSLAQALAGQGKYAEARQAEERRIELEPQSLDARFQMGRICLQAKDYRGAEQAFQEALGLSPDSWQVHSALGDVYEQQNAHEAALGEYDAALVAFNSSPDARSNEADAQRNQLQMSRANALAGVKRFHEAETEMRALVAKTPKDATAHSALAQVLDTAGKHDEAISEYKAALALTPDDAITWGNLGWAQYGAGSYDDALQSSRKALTLDNTLSYVRFNLGLIYAVRNQWDLAEKEYKAAVDGAAPADIEAGIGDVREALTKQPNDAALQRALDYLSNAKEKALEAES